MMRPADVARRGAEYLGHHGVDGSTREAETLLMRILDVDRVGLYTRQQGLSTAEAKAFGRALCRRCTGVPLQHLTGEQGFRRLVLEVRPGVFVPRPETETLVEVALSMVGDAPVVVDLCTGSGAIALAVADERPGATVFATDISADAVSLTAANASRLGLAVTVAQGDLFEPLADELRGAVDLVVANPPYLPVDDGSRCRPTCARTRPLRSSGASSCMHVSSRMRSSGFAPTGRSSSRSTPGRGRRSRGRPSRGVRAGARRGRSHRPRPRRLRSAAVSDPVADAIAAARRGELIVFPTDTVYGIAGRPDDAAATDRLFDAKQRPRDLTLPVLVSNAGQAREIARFDDRAARLAQGLWPGALTLVLPRTPASEAWDLGGDQRRSAFGCPIIPSRSRCWRAVRWLRPAPTGRARSRPAPAPSSWRPSAAMSRCTSVRTTRSSASPLAVVSLLGDPLEILRPGELDPAVIARLSAG